MRSSRYTPSLTSSLYDNAEALNEIRLGVLRRDVRQRARPRLQAVEIRASHPRFVSMYSLKCPSYPGSAPRSATEIWAVETLRKLYPGHSVTISLQGTLNPLAAPGALVQPISPDDIISRALFIPLARRAKPVPGVVLNDVEYGAFRVAWKASPLIPYDISHNS
jgi:hypothetical protein